MKQVKKYSFSMMEVLITLTLFSMLLGFLSFWKIKLALQNRNNEDIVRIFLKEDLVYKEMTAIFERRERGGSFIVFNENSCSLFFDKPPSLFNELSGRVKAFFEYSLVDKTLYLTVSKTLENGREIKEKIILLDHIDNLRWEFVEDVFKVRGGNFLGLKVHVGRSPLGALPGRAITYVF